VTTCILERTWNRVRHCLTVCLQTKMKNAQMWMWILRVWTSALPHKVSGILGTCCHNKRCVVLVSYITLHSVLGDDHCSMSLTLLHFLIVWYKWHSEIVWTELVCSNFINFKVNTEQLLAQHMLLQGVLWYHTRTAACNASIDGNYCVVHCWCCGRECS
jgi:hypothetical protein